ncbi:hypothetical protein ACH5RR_029321 [Cinchona calisaya]|uniref:RING-type domain-containing protein n=1 Tax=Cinchona calisaya TaxID=153742 RepID=A0ABD2YV73_9GENT
MDSQDRPNRIWKSVKQRLRFKLMACCGSSWNRVSDFTIREEDVVVQDQTQVARIEAQAEYINEDELDPMIVHVGQTSHARGMNLAMLLAAERHWRKAGPRKHKKPLMRLFEEIDGVDSKTSKWYIKEGGIDSLCCICMERNKGAAFIPCGHTYCRVCSRDLWLNGVSCPLCNRRINQILDIF